MTTEKKFVSLKEFKAKTDSVGGFSGYANAYGIIDNGGDICVRGCAADSLPALIESGFAAHSHDWSFEDGLIGYFNDAKEDDTGLFIDASYHSTQDAQTVRTKVNERLGANKTVGLSIGYRTLVSKEIQPDQYDAELPKYLRPDKIQEQLEKAKSYPYGIRILEKIDVYETSIVTAAMNRASMVTSAKAAQGNNLIFNLRGVLESGTFVENSDLMVSVCDELVGAMREFTTRTKSRIDFRAKEGRTISRATLEKLKACNERMKEMSDTHLPEACSMLDELISMAEPSKSDAADDVIIAKEALNLFAEIQIFNDRVHAQSVALN